MASRFLGGFSESFVDNIEGSPGRLWFEVTVVSVWFELFDVSSYLINILFKSRIAFFWYSISLACLSFFKVSSWIWFKTFALKSSNSFLLMQSVAAVFIPIPHKTKTKATDNWVSMLQTQRNRVFQYDCSLYCRLKLLCKAHIYELYLGNLTDKH